MRNNRGASRSSLIVWLGVIVLVVGLVAAQQWLLEVPTERERVKMAPSTEQPKPPPKPKPQGRATMTPGRVVSLDTAKGQIEFVLYEKDCPITTRQIVQMVEKGCYSGLPFIQVEPNLLIQTAECRTAAVTIPMEIREGLVHNKGAVGLARKKAPDSGTTAFYILMEPAKHLDCDRTVFGQLINGMDVCFKIRRDDVIRRASLRPFTEADRKRLSELIGIQVERQTQ